MNQSKAKRTPLTWVCFILGCIVAGWSAIALAATYERLLEVITPLFDGAAFTGEVGMALFELLGYVFGFAAGLCAIDGSRPSAKAMFDPTVRAIVAACFAWAGVLCMPAVGVAHMTICPFCTSPFTVFTGGMWTSFAVMLTGGVVFTLFCVVSAKGRAAKQSATPPIV